MQETNELTMQNRIDIGKQEMLKAATERVTEISKEFTAGFKFLANHPKSVTFFGSSMTAETDPYYISARELSGRLVKELGYSVVSGGGPGIMEAADRGAYEAGGNSIGLLIDLPNEQPTNPYITESLSFYYFFARKVCLSYGAEVFLFYPGGLGTMDEFFEIITLVQTGKLNNVPIICVGSEYWNGLMDFMTKEMLMRGAIQESDLNLFTITDDHDEIIEIIRKVQVRANIPFTGQHVNQLQNPLGKVESTS
jgi:uncharacterized protein (TIGR00730 family)